MIWYDIILYYIILYYIIYIDKHHSIRWTLYPDVIFLSLSLLGLAPSKFDRWMRWLNGWCLCWRRRSLSDEQRPAGCGFCGWKMALFLWIFQRWSLSHGSFRFVMEVPGQSSSKFFWIGIFPSKFLPTSHFGDSPWLRKPPEKPWKSVHPDEKFLMVMTTKSIF